MSAEMFLRWTSGPARPLHGRRRSILWPVYVWPVMAPDLGRSELNAFQEAILGLLNTGLRDLNEVARLLDLERDLVAYIIATQLQPNQWVDPRQDVTDLGRDVLAGRTSGEVALSVQYSFQDAVTGTWLPRLATGLPELEPLRAGQAFPEFIVDRDSGERVRPFLMTHVVEPGKPDKRTAKLALTQFLQDLRRANLSEDDYIPQSMGDDFDFADSAPMRAHVWCDVFVSERDLQPWLVSDPWRITAAATWLREPLTKNIARFPGVGKRIAELVGVDIGASIPVDEYLRQLDLRVELELAELPALHQHPLLREHVGRLLRQLRRIEGMDKPHPEDLASIAAESGAVLEAALKRVLERWPIDASVWPTRDRVGETHFRSDVLGSIVSDSAARILGGLRASDVRLAAIHRDRPLKALLAAALLSTHQRDDHPFGRLPATALQIDELLSVADMRNKGSHASGAALDLRNVLARARFALKWPEQLLPLF